MTNVALTRDATNVAKANQPRINADGCIAYGLALKYTEAVFKGVEHALAEPDLGVSKDDVGRRKVHSIAGLDNERLLIVIGEVALNDILVPSDELGICHPNLPDFTSWNIGRTTTTV
jgi:hypothetical protein